MLLPNIKVLSEEGNISTYSRHPLQKLFGDLGLPPTPGSSSASSPYPFCISVAWPWCGPSCTTKHQQQCQGHTHSYLYTYAHSLHPQLPTHLCTQPTPTVTYTLLCRQPKSWIVWQHLGLVDGCLLATTVSLFLLFSQVLHSSLKKKCCLPHIVVKIK